MPAVDLAVHIIPARIKSDLSASPRVIQRAPMFSAFSPFFLLYRFTCDKYTFAESLCNKSREYTTSRTNETYSFFDPSVCNISPTFFFVIHASVETFTRACIKYV